MSKRFGRNQKRKARAAIAEAAAVAERHRVELDKTSHMLASLMREKQELEIIFRDIAEMLPKGSALLPPETKSVGGLSKGRASFFMSYPPAPSLDKRGACDLVLEAQRMRAVIVTSVERGDALNFGFHIRAKFGDDCVAYSISDKALQLMPQHRLKELITQSAASQLAAFITSKLGARYE